MKQILLIFIVAFTNLCNAQIVNIPDANFKAKLIAANANNSIASTQTPDITSSVPVNTFNIIDTNGDGEIQVSEAEAIKYLNVNSSSIGTMLGINAFYNLQFLRCASNRVVNLDVSGLTNLKYLQCGYNQLTNLDVSGLTNLKYLRCYENQLTSLNLSGLPNLTEILCNDNQLTNLNVSGLTKLKNFECNENKLTNLDISGLSNLSWLICSTNRIVNLDASGLTKLQYLNCNSNRLVSLNVSGLTNLQYLACNFNQLPILNISGLTNLLSFGCINNNLVSLDVLGLTKLTHLYCTENQLIRLNVSGLTNLTHLYCDTNKLVSLDVSRLTNLLNLTCNNNNLESLDVSRLTNLVVLNCENNQLTSLFVKNGKNEEPLLFFNNPNLTYICADEEDIIGVQNRIIQYGYTNCNVGTYCSFTSGGTFYTIRGNQKYDSNNNGCDSTDIIFPNFKCSITDGTNVGSFISDSSGTYNIPVQAGIQTITPIIENPTYFNFNPSTFNVSFPDTTSPHIQDICITANGTHHDLEVLLIPMNEAGPGFKARYKLVYKNKGTSTQSGTIDFSFDDTVLDLVSSTPDFISQSTGKLIWNFTNLLPFESREIIIVLKLNAPTATPPLNIGDILTYTVSINGQIDETPIDNIATLNQNVVNSFDPNDKTCLEGIRITPDKVGNYVHYLIRFENKGTANAQNIVVKDIIDTTKFDINTLIPIKASHNFETRISSKNKVEFIFQDINLPFDDENNDGYVTFKIKTKPNLVLGDTFSNVANIYFDYNFPIVTNNFTTNIQNTLGTQQNYIVNDINTYPNPVYNVLHFKTENKIIKVEVYDVLSRIISTNPVIDNKVDLSDLKNGSYILKLFTTKGVATTKIIKA
jgi:Leucine-rich repeat (LRR) protein